MEKKLFAAMFIKNGKCVKDFKNHSLYQDGDAVKLAKDYEANSIDGLIIFDLSSEDAEHDRNLNVIREISRNVGIPMIGAGNIKRPEDVKKLLYAGCTSAVLNMSKASNMDMLEEVSKRFGKEKIAVCCNEFSALHDVMDKVQEYVRLMLLMGDNLHLYEAVRTLPLNTVPLLTIQDHQKVLALEKEPNVLGVAGVNISDEDIPSLRDYLASQGVTMFEHKSPIEWSEMKKNSDGLIPVVVQDYTNDEVLMVAYMNEEAFLKTIRTGRMTYFSRSRQELWVKGATSGHYQYLRQMSIDCDNDTLLVKVIQQGAACHTGNRSCFYRDLVKKEGGAKNAASVFEDVFGIIMDRKHHPKEGSYTNYLFDKGIDKILKKLGEEATEIIIAAKNPDPEEIKYEAADFLYHLMVLMAERGVTWEDITEELSKR